MATPEARGGPPRSWFLVVTLLALALRLPHLGPALDDPHAWRQMDTAHYARAFAEEGFDLLRPSVCWMGPHKAVALEFPLPEAAIGLAWRVAGSTELIVARAVCLAFFLLAAWSFHGLAALVAGAATARWATLLYLVSPLSLFYSRAVHVDFAVLVCAQACALHTLRGVERGARRELGWAAAWLVPALLVKAPYVVPVACLAAGVAFARGRLVWLLRAAPLALPALVALAWWRAHAEALNAAVPDWSFIPDYHPMTNMWRWYFGPLAQRLEPGAWLALARRLVSSVAGPAAAPLALAGLWLARRRPETSALLAWGLGLLLHVLVFFNLNLRHDYYQLPLVALFAVLAALPLAELERRARERGRARPWLAPLLLCAALAPVQEAWTRTRFYDIPAVSLAAGELVRRHTPAGALVAAVGRDLDARSPLVLYPAHRYGWSIREEFLAEPVVRGLLGAGATHLAHLRGVAPAPGVAALLRPAPRQSLPLPGGLTLDLYDLRALRAGPGSP